MFTISRKNVEIFSGSAMLIITALIISCVLVYFVTKQTDFISISMRAYMMDCLHRDSVHQENYLVEVASVSIQCHKSIHRHTHCCDSSTNSLSGNTMAGQSGSAGMIGDGQLSCVARYALTSSAHDVTSRS